jgi:carboxyl-terminal processing protease
VHYLFHEAHDRVPSQVQNTVEVKQLERPRFAFDYRIDDRERGNGDGLLQLGEEAELAVTVQNVGQGEGHALVAYLRNDESDPERRIFIRRGRVEGDGLAPGGQATFRFRFKVKADTPGQIPLWLGVYDNELDDGASEKLILSVVPATSVVRPLEAVLTPRAGNHVPIFTHPVAAAPTVARAEGAVVARGRIEGWYRVLTNEGLYGWVPDDQISTGSGSIAMGPMRELVPSGPPEIRLSTPSPNLSTVAAELTLEGEVVGDRPIKDLRVFVNSKKIFFKSSPGPAASTLPFLARVSLVKGLNRIDVVARQRDEAATSKTLLIHRTGPE